MSSKLATQQLKSLGVAAAVPVKGKPAVSKSKVVRKKDKAPSSRKKLIKAIGAGEFSTAKQAIYSSNKKYFAITAAPSKRTGALLQKLQERRR